MDDSKVIIEMLIKQVEEAGVSCRLLVPYLGSPYQEAMKECADNCKKTIVEAKKFLATNFTVDKFPLQGPDGIWTPEYGLFRSDRTDSTAYVSTRAVKKGYVPHQSEDLAVIGQAVGHVFDTEIEVQGYFDNGHFLSIMPTGQHREEIYGEKDNVFPRFSIQAPYGSGAFISELGIYRDACKNLSILRSVEKTSTKIRHSKHLHLRMDELVETFTNLHNTWYSVVDAVRGMQQKEVKLNEFLAKDYPMPKEPSASQRTRHENRIKSIFSRVYKERLETGRDELKEDPKGDWIVSAYEAFNGVQGFVQHDKTRRGKPSSFQRSMYAVNDEGVKAAEVLALSV